MIRMYKDFIKRIYEFNYSRGLLRQEFDAELMKKQLDEEIEELMFAKNWQEQVDALCDIIVFATGGLFKLHVNPEEAMEETLSEIESRKQCPIQAHNWSEGGMPFNEKWQKDKHQCPNTLYEADYKRNDNVYNGR